jgi:hypothetical protein
MKQESLRPAAEVLGLDSNHDAEPSLPSKLKGSVRTRLTAALQTILDGGGCYPTETGIVGKGGSGSVLSVAWWNLDPRRCAAVGYLDLGDGLSHFWLMRPKTWAELRQREFGEAARRHVRAIIDCDFPRAMSAFHVGSRAAVLDVVRQSLRAYTPETQERLTATLPKLQTISPNVAWWKRLTL